MRLGAVRVHVDVDDEVRGVSRCAENPSPLRGLVDGALVVRVVLQVLDEDGLQADDRGLNVEDLRVTLRENLVHVVPLAALDEEPVHELPVVLLESQPLLLDDLDGGFLQELEVERQSIYRDLVLARVVLECSRQESLREVEPAHPVDPRWDRAHPFLVVRETLQQVLNVALKRLQRRVRVLLPVLRYHALLERAGDLGKWGEKKCKNIRKIINFVENFFSLIFINLKIVVQKFYIIINK